MSKKWDVAVEEALSSRDSYVFDRDYLGDGMTSQEFLKFGILDMEHKVKNGYVPDHYHNSNFGLLDGEIFDNLFDCEQVYNEYSENNDDYKIILILTEVITTFFKSGDRVNSEEKAMKIVKFITPL